VRLRRALISAVAIMALAVGCRQLAGYDGDTVEPDQPDTGGPETSDRDVGPGNDGAPQDTTSNDPEGGDGGAAGDADATAVDVAAEAGDGHAPDGPPGDAPAEGATVGECPPVGLTGTQIVPEPGFETGVPTLQGWSAFASGTLVKSNGSDGGGGFAHCGSFSAEVYNRGAYYAGPSYLLPVYADAGASYSFSGWVMQDGDGGLSILANGVFNCPGDAGTIVTTYPYFGQATTASKTWMSIAGSFTVPPGCASATVYINQPNNDAGLPALYVDDFYIYQQL
jgi:hypothetical protein